MNDTFVDDPKPTSDIMVKLKRFVALTKYKRELDELSAEYTGALQKLEPEISEYFANEGVQNVNVDGMTVYAKVDKFVNKRPDLTTEQVIGVLNETGYSYLVAPGYNAARLKSAVLTAQDAGEELPENLLACLSISEVVKVVARKST